VEWLKVYALSSNPCATKINKYIHTCIHASIKSQGMEKRCSRQIEIKRGGGDLYLYQTKDTLNQK
jgi:hypothetical protein